MKDATTSVIVALPHNQGNHDIKYFNCSTNNGGHGNCPSTHYIRLDFLEQVVLQEIQRLTQFASEYEDDFIKSVMGHSMKVAQDDRAKQQRGLDGLLARDRELDKLFERLYEDNVSGKVTDERFSKMSKRYEQEQGENSAKIKTIKRVLKENGGQLMTTDLFLEIVHQYTDVRKLTQRMIAELIDHIEVYHAEKISGKTTQKITIYYNCIGAFTVPERKDIPDVDVSMKTRKGVTLGYSQSQKAG